MKISKPADYRRRLAPDVPQSTMLGSDARYGVATLAGPGGAKSTIIDAALCDAARHGHPVLAVSTDRTLAHKLRCAVPRGSPYPVHMIDPTVEGGKALDATKLWRTQIDRLAFSNYVSPVREGDHAPFFAQLTQEVNLFSTSHLNGRDCRLGDLIGLSTDPELMDALGDAIPDYGPSPWRLTGIHSRSGRDSRATVQVALRQLQVYAALSQGPHVAGLVNPFDLIHGPPCAIVLVLDERFKLALSGFFASVVEVVCQAKLAMGGDEFNQLHAGIDELPALARMEVVPQMARRGRKAFCSYYVGAQSLASVKARYPNDWSDILSLARYKVFGTLYDKDSAVFASNSCGVRMCKEKIAPEYYGFFNEREDGEYKISVVERPFVHWGSFLDIPLADWAIDRMYGVLCFPGPKGKVPFASRFRHLAQTPPPPVYTPADPKYQILPPMTAADHRRLGFPPEVLIAAAAAREANRKRMEGRSKKKEDDDD